MSNKKLNNWNDVIENIKFIADAEHDREYMSFEIGGKERRVVVTTEQNIENLKQNLQDDNESNIDEALIFDEQLSEEEIQTLYKASKIKEKGKRLDE